MKMDLTGSITKKEAMDLLLSKWNPEIKSEIILLKDALNRVLYEDVYSVNTIPKVRSSKLDGVGVKSENFKEKPDTTSWVSGVDYVRADTGDDFSDDFDSVIAIENVSFDENGKITILDSDVTKGQNINSSGSLIKEGQLVARGKTVLSELHLAVLATSGMEMVKVIKKPRVVYIPTGSELIEAFTEVKRGQNIESNSLMVKAFLKKWGAEAIIYPIVKDKVLDLEASLEKALKEADIVLINGGSSKGEEDYNTSLMKKREILIQHRVLAAPGRPVGIGIENNIPVINVPGPTIGTFNVMDWCVSPLVNQLLEKPQNIREKVKARLLEGTKSPLALEFYMRLLVSEQNGEYVAKPLERDITSSIEANALFVTSIGKMEYEKGEVIEVELLYGKEFIKKHI